MAAICGYNITLPVLPTLRHITGPCLHRCTIYHLQSCKVVMLCSHVPDFYSNKWHPAP